MNLLITCAVFSSVSFLAYAYSYFRAPKMKNEFKRFGLEKLGLTVIILEIIGAIGLLLGLKVNLILVISSLGLAVLMFAGLIVRIMVKDNFWISFPAFFYLALNTFIFWQSMSFIG